MSNLIILGIAAIIVAILWRSFAPALTGRRRRDDRPPIRDAKTLERDPDTGVYRQRDREE